MESERERQREVGSGSRSRAGDVGLQLCFDLIVGEEGLVARVRHCQRVPVLQQSRPRLEQPAAHTQRHRELY